MAQRCKATSRAGKRCRQSAILGGTVCRFHGGSAPQVKRKAEERLAHLVDPSIAKLEKLIESNSDNVALGAIRDILDRSGFRPVMAQETEVSINLVSEQRAALIAGRERAANRKSEARKSAE
jgi:phosphopentomutase